MKLRDKNLLPPITEEGKSFALKICAEYPLLDFEEICWLIRAVSFNISGDYGDIRDLMKRYSRSFKKLLDRDIEFKGISIATNKGIIQISASDPLFAHFIKPIKRVKSQYKDDLNYLSKALPQGVKDGTFSIIVDYFYETSLGPSQRRVAIGMFLEFFKLFARKPIKGEKEYNQNPTHDSYKDSLEDRVKPLVNTYLKTYRPNLLKINRG